MKISVDQIKAQLGFIGIHYHWEDEGANRLLTIASLFNPVDEGFYFFSGTGSFQMNIRDSIILVHEQGEVDPTKNGNVFIPVNRDPQEVYYLILSNLFSRRSNGHIAKTAIVHPNAKIGANVQIDDFCVIEAATIGDNVIIESHSKIHENVIIGDHTTIGSMSIIGTQGVAWVWNPDQSERIVQPQLGGVEIGSRCFIGANTIIVRGSLNEYTKIGNNTLMAPGGRIGHGTNIGSFVHFANNVITGGNTQIGDFCFVGSGAVFRPKVKIHPKTIIGAGTVVVKNSSSEGWTITGVPGREMPTKERPEGMPIPKR